MGDNNMNIQTQIYKIIEQEFDYFDRKEYWDAISDVGYPTPAEQDSFWDALEVPEDDILPDQADMATFVFLQLPPDTPVTLESLIGLMDGYVKESLDREDDGYDTGVEETWVF